ncbi:hypothetical protein PGTUg99_027093 [Puccinia graminis f. sp. tritici]|uniref:Uncharacterized protein n=1 Tax=Puccinia graminis f. sp. tritici TaxID=56615 RepID=A0A5B0P5W5_PUCGR|nr:hypothetical protein PGTUg99_027093 [Puccinia graminis f. sp. tritici]
MGLLCMRVLSRFTSTTGSTSEHTSVGSQKTVGMGRLPSWHSTVSTKISMTSRLHSLISSTKKTNSGIGFKKTARQPQTIQYNQNNFCVYLKYWKRVAQQACEEKLKAPTSVEGSPNV